MTPGGGVFDNQITRVYEMVTDYHGKYLRKKGVLLPSLKRKEEYTKDAIVLVYLAQGYPDTRSVSKSELTGFIRRFYPIVPDVQQARHLAMQKGWWIVSGTRGNHRGVGVVGPGEYRLMSLTKSYPSFVGRGWRRTSTADFEGVKRRHGLRCATCGSREGESIF
jgi:hypothetical protein